MRRLFAVLIAVVSATAFTQIASAADLSRKAPVAPPPPPPVYSWTGWYVGGNVGYSWGRANTDLVGNANFSTPQIGAFGSSFAGSNTAHPNGVIGGGQIGFNYRFSPNGVLGFEADIQGSGERGSGQFADASTACVGGGCVATTMLTSYVAKIDWFGTVRGRLGFLPSDQLLIYATGGLAYGKVAVSGTANISAAIVQDGNLFTPATAPFAASKTNIGFVVGAGMEGRLYWLPANWTWKLEYLYMDLGSVDTTTSVDMAPPVGTTLNPGSVATAARTRFTDNIVRVGLNYQFH